MATHQNETKLRFILPGVEAPASTSRSVGPVARSATQVERQLLEGLEVKQHFDLSPTSRSAASGQEATLEAVADDILALEMEDGFIFYTSAGRLADDLERLEPAAVQDGAVRLDALHARGPVSRGLGDWILRALSVVGFKKDALEEQILDAAVDKAEEWLGDKARELVEKGASWAGTKALMWAIEKQLDPGPGLYRWVDDTGAPGDLKTVAAGEFEDWHPDKPILVFIHGTASSTLGSFGDLQEAGSAAEWDRLFDKFGRHIYAFEHRTFSESPIENALALAGSLPAGARLSVVTHSRGGLVGDLLCMESLSDGLVERFDRGTQTFDMADEADRKNLLALNNLLVQSKFRIERYVRVASPAQGTLLASCHLDAFLSALLHLIGMVPYLQASPVYAVAKRIILQIVKNRTDPRLVPGIEAMLPDSPLAALVGQAQPQEDTAIGVIAGDIEGGNLLKRIGVFLTDFIFFEEEDNDLVVDTESMFGGLARDKGYYLFDQGADVNHFRYFSNGRTRQALLAWLTDESPSDIRPFRPIAQGPRPTPVRAAPTGPRPTLFFLPGIMGSHLRSGDKDRVWFDFFDIAMGGMQKISIDKPGIHPDGLFDRFYGGLCDYLEETHAVQRFAYDWRRPLEETAGKFADAIDSALHTTDEPVRIMAHSMGGLVVRMMMAHHPKVWRRLAEREGARFIMLGTPNQGSHLMVETLLGLSNTIRMLSVLDGRHGLQWFLELVAKYPGALQLLPKPGFKDTGNSRHDYYDPQVWLNFKAVNDDFWFGDQLGALLEAGRLSQVRASWGELDATLPDIDKIAYVAGCGQRTPCGIKVDEKGQRLRMIGTLDGDGSVTHASGLLDCLTQNGRVWYMAADHAGLTGQAESYMALLDLLVQGDTARLPQAPPVSRGAAEPFQYDAGPVLYPTAQRLEQSLIGGRALAPRRGREQYTLSVSCLAMDLRHSIQPVLVGHYEGDPIAGAEAQIDQHLANGGLNQRYQMGMYAGAPGSTTIVLSRSNTEQAAANIQRGAVVIGLGHYGELTVGKLGETVRDGVLRYLLHLVDIGGGRLSDQDAPRDVHLSTLLLGYNSTTNISIADSVHTITRGVMEANRQFAEVMSCQWRVAHLEFIELFLDIAISAAAVIRQLDDHMVRVAESMNCRLASASTLQTKKGARQRLEAISGMNYWPRLSITNDERREDPCPPECREKQWPVRSLEDICPPECLEKLGKSKEISAPLPTHPQRRTELARRLRFMFLSQRARAETVVQQRQPGLVETMVERSIMDTAYKPELSNALYQLLMPHDFKQSARQVDRLVLVVDGYTANLPWEMLAVDGEPLIRKTALVRQFATTRYRPQVRNTLDKSAYVVGNPSTRGYYRAFPDPRRPDGDGLDPLPGAKSESQTVRNNLASQGYDVVMAPSESEGLDVINKLYLRPYRIIHISGHGVFQAGHGDDMRSGVVLSDGLFLTAAEIGQLEVVPDLVFLNCCFLGRVDHQPSTAYNRLAYGVARELIEIGVRAVVVAGWAVRDDAGEYFAETFYRALLHEQKTFGEAVRKARRKTHDEPRFRGCNTWGAYQAYGDPGFRMDPASRETPGGGADAPVARVGFLESIRILTNELSQPEKEVRISLKHMEDLLKQSPRAWLANPEVSYALARFVGSTGNFAEAIRYYQQAVETGDHLGEVPILAIQELANHEARQGEKMQDKALVQRAIKRLYALMEATDGPEAPEDSERGASNVERCGLMGSAYKRLAATLAHWSQPEDDPRIPNGIEQALTLSVEWYRIAEGRPGQPDFSPYLVQNRLAMQAVLGTAAAASAELARDAGKTARERYQSSRDFWDLIMVGDGELIAGIIDGSMSTRPSADDATQAVIDCYLQLQEQLPRNQREFDSVVTQVNLLKRFVEKRAAVDTNRARELGYLAANLGRVACALDPSEATGGNPSEKAAKIEVRAERGATTKAIKKQIPKAKPKPTPKRKPPKGKK